LIYIGASKRMDPSETSQKDVIIQDDNVADGVLWIESSSRVGDDDGLDTKQLEDAYRIGDLFY
jgi:hypothetical protein